jgi:mycothiol synthase
MSPSSSVTPHVPAGYSVGRPSRDQLPAIVAFSTGCDRHDFGGVDLTLASFEMAWAMPGFDPTADAWTVKAADGELAGYAHLTRRPGAAAEAVGWVSPEHRGRGVGGLLIGLAEGRARELVDSRGYDGPRAIVHWTNSDAPGAADLLTARGYRVNRTFWRMVIALGATLPPPPS